MIFRAFPRGNFRLMTSGESTADFLTSMLGLRLGAPKTALWQQLRRALVSPLFHGRFLARRLRDQVAGAPLGYALGAGGFLAGLLAGVTVTQTWWPFLLVWGIPMTVGYQIATALRLSVEHLWPSPAQADQHDRAAVASLTQAVFLGERVPDATLPRMRKAWAWMRWVARMLVYLLVRYLLLPGDTVVHDYHHRHASSKAWPYALFARQQDIEAGHPGWPPYAEVWGFGRAIDAVLESLSQAHPPAV